MERKMSVTVNIESFKNCFDFVIDINTKCDIRIPMLLHGVHALGKTEVVAQIAKAIDYNYVPLYLSTQDVSDLIGLPYKEHLFYRDGKQITEKEYIDVSNMSTEELGKLCKRSTTRFAMPDWLSDAMADERPCIFFLDEMNRGPLYVLQTMLPFVLEGRLHTHRIRSNDIVIGAMNPDTAEYSVEAVSDKALLSRFAHFYFEPEVSEWMTYAMKNGVHPSVIEVVQTSDNIFGNEAVPECSRVQVTPDRRNIYKIGQFFNHIEERFMKNNAVSNLCTALVGEDVAISLVTAYNTKVTLSPTNIFDGTIFDAGIEYETDLDRIRLINEALIHVLVDGESKIWQAKNDSPSNWDGESAHDYAKYIITDTEQDNLRKWISICPKDARLGFIKQLRTQMIEKYKTDEHINRGAFILMALLMSLDEDLVDEVFPD